LTLLVPIATRVSITGRVFHQPCAGLIGQAYSSFGKLEFLAPSYQTRLSTSGLTKHQQAKHIHEKVKSQKIWCERIADSQA
jgi:hypothetical protein